MKTKPGEHPYGDIGQLVLFILFIVVWTGDSFFLRLSTFFAAYVPPAVRLAVLLAALAAAVLFIKGAHFVVRHDDGPHRVVTEGVFRHVRHPLYLGCFLIYLGLSMSTFSIISLVFAALIFAFYNFIADYEERYLVREYGDDYRKYRAVTGKWLPRLLRRTRA